MSMTIKEVEQKTGLARSNIRFYEKEKLIEPEKNNSNGYRNYSQKDVDKIEKIAYLRTLGISIENIRSIMSHELTLHEVIKSQSVRLEEQMAELNKSKMLCDRMLQSDHLTFENLNIETYVTDVRDYWAKNKKRLHFDSAGFCRMWESNVTWWILFIICLVVAVFSCPQLPADIPIQWKDGIATSWVSKYFIFAFPTACVLIRSVLQPIMYGKLQLYIVHTTYTEMVTKYVINSMCLVVLSVEIFLLLFVIGFVKNIVIMLLIEGIILAGLLFKGIRG